jgi:glycosyltransferase involved in cell wall biosynthesis
MRAFKNKGYKVIAVAPEDGEYDKLLKNEFEFYPVKHLNRKGTNPFQDIRLLLEYFNLFKKIKSDLVINFTIKPNIYGSISAGLLGIPSISVITGLGYAFIKETWLTKVIKVLYKIAFKFNKAVIFQNIDDMETLKNLCERKNYLIKSSGIDTEFFNPNRCVKKKNEGFSFLFVGRLLKDKGIYELIEAFKKLKNEYLETELIIIGDVDEGNPNSLKKEELEQWVEEELITWYGFQKDVRPFYCMADCVVLPSSYREGVPRVLLEAMAMEKPIITTDAPGCRDVCIDGVNGFLVKPKDVESLYLAMKKAVEMGQEGLRKMGKKGREIVEERYEISKIVGEYVKIIENVLNKKI